MDDWSAELATLAKQVARLQENLSAQRWSEAEAIAATIRQQMERVERYCVLQKVLA